MVLVCPLVPWVQQSKFMVVAVGGLGARRLLARAPLTAAAMRAATSGVVGWAGSGHSVMESAGGCNIDVGTGVNKKIKSTQSATNGFLLQHH